MFKCGFLFFETCFTFSLSLRIYGGKLVLSSDKIKFPYHLQLLINHKLLCGASLIAPR